MAIENWDFYSAAYVLLEIIAFCFGLVVNIIFFKKYKTNPTKIKKYLFFILIPLTLVPLFFLIDDFLKGVVYEANIGLSLVMLMPSVIFLALLYFGTEIFMEVQEKRSRKTEIFRIVFTIFQLVMATWGSLRLLNRHEEPNATGGILFGVYFGSLLIVILFIASNSFKLARLVNNQKYRQSLMSIGVFIYTFIGVFVFVSLDFFVDYGVYSIFGIIAFLCLNIVIYEGYRGFVNPKEEKKNN